MFVYIIQGLKKNAVLQFVLKRWIYENKIYICDFEQYLIFILLPYWIVRGRRGAETKQCECNATGVGSIAIRGSVLLINIFISSL